MGNWIFFFSWVFPPHRSVIGSRNLGFSFLFCLLLLLLLLLLRAVPDFIEEEDKKTSSEFFFLISFFFRFRVTDARGGFVPWRQVTPLKYRKDFFFFKKKMVIHDPVDIYAIKVLRLMVRVEQVVADWLIGRWFFFLHCQRFDGRWLAERIDGRYQKKILVRYFADLPSPPKKTLSVTRKMEADWSTAEPVKIDYFFVIDAV